MLLNQIAVHELVDWVILKLNKYYIPPCCSKTYVDELKNLDIHHSSLLTKTLNSYTTRINECDLSYEYRQIIRKRVLALNKLTDKQYATLGISFNQKIKKHFYFFTTISTTTLCQNETTINTYEIKIY